MLKRFALLLNQMCNELENFAESVQCCVAICDGFFRVDMERNNSTLACENLINTDLQITLHTTYENALRRRGPAEVNMNKTVISNDFL